MRTLFNHMFHFLSPLFTGSTPFRSEPPTGKKDLNLCYQQILDHLSELPTRTFTHPDFTSFPAFSKNRFHLIMFSQSLSWKKVEAVFQNLVITDSSEKLRTWAIEWLTLINSARSKSALVHAHLLLKKIDRGNERRQASPEKTQYSFENIRAQLNTIGMEMNQKIDSFDDIIENSSPDKSKQTAQSADLTDFPELLDDDYDTSSLIEIHDSEEKAKKLNQFLRTHRFALLLFAFWPEVHFDKTSLWVKIQHKETIKLPTDLENNPGVALFIIQQREVIEEAHYVEGLAVPGKMSFMTELHITNKIYQKAFSQSDKKAELERAVSRALSCFNNSLKENHNRRSN